MSYDVSLEIDSGAGHLVECWSGNMTSNVSSLWTDALALPERPWMREGEQVLGSLPSADGGWERMPMYNRGLRLLNDAPASEAAGILADAVARARAWPQEKVASYDAANGWGTGEQAVQFLDEIAQACARHPRAVVHVGS